MIAEPNAISHGLTTALTGGLTRGGCVFAVISAAKPGTAAQERASVAANAIFFLGLRSPGAICAKRSTAALAVRTRVLLIISLLSRWPTTGRIARRSCHCATKRAYGLCRSSSRRILQGCKRCVGPTTVCNISIAARVVFFHDRGLCPNHGLCPNDAERELTVENTCFEQPVQGGPGTNLD